jgi:hypothetical protein
MGKSFSLEPVSFEAQIRTINGIFALVEQIPNMSAGSGVVASLYMTQETEAQLNAMNPNICPKQPSS